MNLICILFLSFLFVAAVAESDKSNIRCNHLRYPDFKFTIREERSPCSICNHVFQYTVFRLIPYSQKNGIANKKIENVFASCCKSCPGFKLNETFVLHQVRKKELKRSLEKDDIVYPIFAFSNSIHVYGGYFIPFHEPAGGVYITEKEEFSVTKLISACFGLWPLFVAGMSLVMIAGFIGWLLEFRSNKEEFPKEFIRGWWEGIWWSFVTMSTVGYGDKSPRSTPARLFAFVWIYVGIVICGILVASLTTIIIESTTEKYPSMAGANVGMLPNRMYDAYLISSHGGRKESAQLCYREITSIESMVENLKNKKLDGFLLDKQTYWNWLSLMNDHDKKGNKFTSCNEIRDMISKTRTRGCPTQLCRNKTRICYPLTFQQCREGLLQYFREKTIQQIIPHTGHEMAYGIWMKKRAHYLFFRDAFVNNKITFKSELSSHFEHNEKTEKGVTSMTPFAYPSHYHYLFIINGAIIGIIILFGTIFELVRKERRSEKLNERAPLKPEGVL